MNKFGIYQIKKRELLDLLYSKKIDKAEYDLRIKKVCEELGI